MPEVPILLRPPGTGEQSDSLRLDGEDQLASVPTFEQAKEHLWEPSDIAPYDVLPRSQLAAPQPRRQLRYAFRVPIGVVEDHEAGLLMDPPRHRRDECLPRLYTPAGEQRVPAARLLVLDQQDAVAITDAG